jgi:fimbrial chaperone protein
MNRQLIGQVLRGLAVFFAGAGLAHAGSFSVNPVRVTLSAKQPVAAITVRNAGSEPAVVQLETNTWSQDQGRDVLVPTSDVLATPPIFTVPPGKTQILRIGLRRPSAATGETTYRLVLREVPEASRSLGVKVALRISMPVFVVPASAVAPVLEWRTTRTADGQIRVHVTNTGTAHAQLSKIELALAEGGRALGTRTMADYVLPGNSRSWTLAPAETATVGALVRIASTTDAGSFQSETRLEVETATVDAVSSAPLAAR